MGTFIGTAARLAYGAYKSYTGTATAQSSSPAPRTVTSQHDVKTTYRKKRMPKYKRKRWVKFIKKVQAVEESNSGLQKVVFNDGGEYVTQNTVGGGPAIGKRQQAVFGTLMYSGNGTPDGSLWGVQDIQRVINRGPPSSQYAGSAQPVVNTTKYKFTSAVMDYTITSNASNVCALEVEVYQVRFRRGWNNNTGSNTLSGIIDHFNDKEEVLGNSGISPKAFIYLRGVTPFECGNALGSMGVTIVSKTKYYLAPGNSINLQMRDPKSHYLEPDDVGDGKNGLAYSNWTQGYFCTAKPTRELAAEATFSIFTGCTRTYKYQGQGWKSSGTAYIA